MIKISMRQRRLRIYRLSNRNGATAAMARTATVPYLVISARSNFITAHSLSSPKRPVGLRTRTTIRIINEIASFQTPPRKYAAPFSAIP
jgi:hypothetical protein